ncbi:hypothetical protein D3C79_1069260 [compost metagenome]
MTRYLPEILFTHHKVHGQIALARLAQSPFRQLLQATQLARAQLPGVGDFTVGQFRRQRLATALA